MKVGDVARVKLDPAHLQAMFDGAIERGDTREATRLEEIVRAAKKGRLGRR